MVPVAAYGGCTGNIEFFGGCFSVHVFGVLYLFRTFSFLNFSLFELIPGLECAFGC